MSKTCFKHQCFNPRPCREKTQLGHLPLCRQNNTACHYCAPRPYGRYEPEDVLLP